jgi:glycine/D-amino acid oxidase-like deaminating enzyme
MVQIERPMTIDFGQPPWTPPGPISSSRLPSSSEVVVVGGGVTGLAAALTAAEAGRHVTLVERRFGSGATSRSGGIVLGDTLVGPRAGFDDCDLSLRHWIAQSGVECDLFWNGCLELARDPSLSDHPVDWNENGRVRLVGRVSGGVLDPSKLQTELARLARRAGATLVDGVAVQGLEPASPSSRSSQGVVVVTERGSLRADHVIMAVDTMAWRPLLDPWAERVITVALTTEPLADDVIGVLGLGRHQAFYTRDFPLLWGRVMPDQSLLVGRETLPWPTQSSAISIRERLDEAGGRLALRVRGLHPELREVAVHHLWGGPIARTASGVPAVVQDPRIPQVLWVGGYGGHGLAQAFRLGQVVSTSLGVAHPG